MGGRARPGYAESRVRRLSGDIFFKDSCDTYGRIGAEKRTFAPGKSANVVYCDDWMHAVGEMVRRKDFKVEEIVRSSNSDALDQTDRVARFFKEVYGKKDVLLPIRVDASLPPFTVKVGDVTVFASERIVFSKRVKRLLDVLNAVAYPRYRVPVPMRNRERYRLFRF